MAWRGVSSSPDVELEHREDVEEVDILRWVFSGYVTILRWDSRWNLQCSNLQ
jgi:hypothetical protein